MHCEVVGGRVVPVREGAVQLALNDPTGDPVPEPPALQPEGDVIREAAGVGPLGREAL